MEVHIRRVSARIACAPLRECAVKKAPQPDDLIYIYEAAFLMRCSQRHIANLIAMGRFPNPVYRHAGQQSVWRRGEVVAAKKLRETDPLKRGPKAKPKPPFAQRGGAL
jgi:predicted DNA-binding transcriptional regulator AlpA